MLEDDAEIMSNTQLDALITDEPPEVEAAILEINDDARNLSLQVALAVPLLAALIGLVNSLRMMRLPDLVPLSRWKAPTSAEAPAAIGIHPPRVIR